MERLEIRKDNNDNHEVSLYYSKRQGEKPFYVNTMTKDPLVIALILKDLETNGYPISKAIKKFFQLEESKDWMSL